jgi:hypothetical protein
VIPDNLRFGGGVTGSVFNPAVAIVLIIASVLICVLPQRKIILPFLLTIFLIPADQILVVFGLHFPLLRILILFGMVRIFLIKGKGEWNIFSNGVNKIDVCMILLTVTIGVCGVFIFQSTQAVIFQLGAMYSAFGAYFFLRCVIRSEDDVFLVIRALSVIVAGVGLVMICEQLANGWNPYNVLGGARAGIDMARNGRIRAVGSFAQPIIAGTFGAVTMPLFIGMWQSQKRYRRSAKIGILGATAMIICCNSSTPLFGLLSSLILICIWRFRAMGRIIRWGIVITLLVLNMVMKAPVWHLITRFDISGSSYHRYQLIDQTISHFWEWWLIGTNNNGSWGWEMWDTANQYVATAVSGGLLGLCLLIAIIVFGFKYLGTAREATKDEPQARFYWALSAALLAQLMSFFGISLWDQSIVGWYALLAIIGAVAVPLARTAESPVESSAIPRIPSFNRQVATGWSSRQLREKKPKQANRAEPRRHVRDL